MVNSFRTDNSDIAVVNKVSTRKISDLLVTVPSLSPNPFTLVVSPNISYFDRIEFDNTKYEVALFSGNKKWVEIPQKIIYFDKQSTETNITLVSEISYCTTDIQVGSFSDYIFNATVYSIYGDQFKVQFVFNFSFHASN